MTVVALCGSVRFKDTFDEWERILTLRDMTPLSCCWAFDETVLMPSTKQALDRAHKDRIRICDEVLVLNVGGYIGESTRAEIAYAESLGKTVRYLEKRA